MRMSRARFATRWATWLALFSALCAAAPARAQNPDELLPAESAAKAKAILQQAIVGLGGPVYLAVRDSDCSARLAQFDSTGEAGGSLDVRILHQGSDKTRIEFHGNNYITNIFYYEVHGKNTIVSVYSGDQGWTLTKDGVTDLPADATAEYQEQTQTSIHTLLRDRLNDPGLVFRYGGTEVVDLKQVDWVEVADREGRTVRIAIDRAGHLPVRSVMSKRDSQTGAHTEQSTLFSNFHLVDGVQTAYRLSQLLNGRQVSETFYERCHYNAGIAPDLFTRSGLEAQSKKPK
jgi:hypothetical protein